jgi:hypothetical protein
MYPILKAAIKKRTFKECSMPRENAPLCLAQYTWF